MGQGTWLIDSGSGGIGRRNSDNSLAVKTLQLGLEMGMTHIDTAEMYGNGRQKSWSGKPLQQQSSGRMCFWLARSSLQRLL